MLNSEDPGELSQDNCPATEFMNELSQVMVYVFDARRMSIEECLDICSRLPWLEKGLKIQRRVIFWMLNNHCDLGL